MKTRKHAHDHNDVDAPLVCWWRTTHGCKPVVYAQKGRKFVWLIVQTDSGVAACKIRRDEVGLLRPLTFNGEPYPVHRAVRLMRRRGERDGMHMTQKARELMGRALNEVTS